MDKLLDFITKDLIGVFTSWVDTIGDTIVIAIDGYSFDICLIVGLVALVLSTFGYDKGKKIATLSPAVYVIIQLFLKGWFGV